MTTVQKLSSLLKPLFVTALLVMPLASSNAQADYLAMRDTPEIQWMCKNWGTYQSKLPWQMRLARVPSCDWAIRLFDAAGGWGSAMGQQLAQDFLKWQGRNH